MKQYKLYLLVAALLIASLLIPSMALAAAPSIEIKGAYEGKLYGHYNLVGEYKDFSIAIKDVKAGYIEWDSSDRGVAYAGYYDEEEDEQYFEKYSDDLSALTADDLKPVVWGGYYPGTAKITATVYEKLDSSSYGYPDYKKVASASFAVTSALVKEKEIKLVEKAETTIAVNREVYLPDFVDEIVSVETTEEEVKQPTYNRRSDLSWTIDKEDLATVDRSGNLKALKEGTVVATAAAKGDPAVTAKVTITIVGEDEYEKQEKVPYTKVTFTQKQYTFGVHDDESEEGIYLSDFISDKEPKNTYGDWLIYESSDPTVVEIPDDYSELTLKKVGKATITVKSFLTGEKLGSCDINVTEGEAKYYESLSFSKAIPTLYKDKDNGFRISDYLITEPEYPANEWFGDLIWTSSDTAIAAVRVVLPEEDEWWLDPYAYLDIKQAGTVTITVSSPNNDKATASVELTIKEFEDIPFTSIEFKPASTKLYLSDYWLDEDEDEDEDALRLYDYKDVSVFDLTRLKALPEDATEEYRFIWSSDKPEILDVWEGGELYITGKTGTVTITAKSYMDQKVYGTFTIEVLEDKTVPFTKLSFTKEKLTVKKSASFIDVKANAGLVTEPLETKVFGDELIWTSSDETVASVADGIVNLLKEGAAKITVRAKSDPKVTASFDLVVEKDDIPYTSVSFTEKEYTVNLSAETFDADKYVITAPADANDYLIWTSSNPQIAAIEDNWEEDMDWDYHWWIGLKAAGTVTITARSNLDSKVVASFTLTVKDDTEAYQKLSMSQSAFTFTTSDDDVNVWDYIVKEPAKDLYPVDEIFMTSSDPTVVRTYGTTLSLEDCKPGTATITVRSAKGVAAPVTFTVTHEKEVLKSIKFVNAPTEFKKSQGWLDLSEYIQTDPWYYAEDFAYELVWSSNEPQYAVAHEFGNIEFVNPGKTVTITVTSADGKVKASHEIKTTDVWVTGITFKKSEISLKVGEEFNPWDNNLVIEPADADYTWNWAWTSSDPSVADIEWKRGDICLDEDGNVIFDDDLEPEYEWYPVVVAKSVGTATISLCIENAYNEVRGSFDVIVTEGGITNIKFAKKEYTKKIGNEDDELKVYFKVEPYNAYIGEKDITIESSDRSVADVIDCFWSANKGMMCAIVKFYQPGTAKITVRSYDNEEIFGSTKVTAEAIAVKKVKLPKKSMKLFYYYTDENHVAYNTYSIQAKIQPSNAWYNVAWETSNAGVAFVENKSDPTYGDSAYIITTGPGTATITVTVDDGTSVRQAKMKITVLTKTVDLKLNKKKATIKMIKGKDNTLQLEAFDDETEYEIPVKWTTSNKKVATVDKNGLVTAKKAGTAVITATTKDGNKTTATCNLTVVKKEVDDFKVKSEVSLKVKETKQLKVKVKPADAYNPALAFTSSDEKVVTVDSKGLLTAVGAGEAEIIIKTKDGTKITKTVKVTVTK